MAEVGIIMGSESDLPTMQAAIDVLNELISPMKRYRLRPSNS